MDFCYLVQIVHVVTSLFFPTNRTLLDGLFALSNGPLCWAILAWRNSLVFHSLDKTTSLFIHAFPALLSFTTRWFHATPEIYDDAHAVGAVSFFGLSILMYLAWQVTYFVVVDIINAEKLRQDPDIQVCALPRRMPRVHEHGIVQPMYRPPCHVFMNMASCSQSTRSNAVGQRMTHRTTAAVHISDRLCFVSLLHSYDPFHYPRLRVDGSFGLSQAHCSKPHSTCAAKQACWAQTKSSMVRTGTLNGLNSMCAMSYVHHISLRICVWRWTTWREHRRPPPPSCTCVSGYFVFKHPTQVHLTHPYTCAYSYMRA